MIKKLNEDILDDAFGVESSLSSKNLILTGKKKKKRKSVLQDLQKDIIDSKQLDTIGQTAVQIDIQSTLGLVNNVQEFDLNNQPAQVVQQLIPEKTNIIQEIKIKTVEAIEETNFNNIVQNIQNKQEQTVRQQAIQSSLYLQKSKNSNQPIIPEIGSEEFQDFNKQVIQNYQDATGNVLSEEVNIVVLKDEISDAADEIPDAGNYDLSDFEITEIPQKKDKTGYIKTKVSIKKNNMPDVINQIASYIKKQTNGLIAPRVMDFRVIGNTNKTQLRGNDLKLSTLSIVFKPNHTKLKVNKGTRFCLSIPEDFNNTGNLIIYIQESRSKHIMVINRADFDSQEIFNEFIGDRIAEYYVMGFDIMKKKLLFHRIDNPLMQVVTKIVETGEYLAKPYVDAEGHMYGIDFKTKGVKNQWMYVQVLEDSQLKGMYTVMALNRVDSSWKYAITGKTKNSISLGGLIDSLYNVLKKLYDADDWVLGENEENYYLADNITYRVLRDALFQMFETNEEHPEIGIDVKKTLSKQETAKAIDPEYGAEAILGKTNHLKYFIVTYLAYQIIGGDTRKGRQYITRQEYYEKYSVTDRRQYQEREKTIIKKEGAQRNYNSRPYIFQVEYMIGNEKHIFRCKSIETLLNATGILTSKPTAPNKPSEY